MTDEPAALPAKPRVRVAAGSSLAYVADSFQNVNQRLGLGAGGQLDGAGYSFNFISRQRLMLEAAYRTSWICGKAVDAPAEDMTKAGITLESDLEPDAERNVYAAYRDLMIGQELANGIRWSRLYGGAVSVMMIDGQNMETPLNIESIKKGQFKGLWSIDRWVAQPEVARVVTELGPDFGLPEFYVVSSDPTHGVQQGARIHYSRVLRFGGLPLPYYQQVTENLWGMSILERMWDRVLAFDSTTMGAAQLVYKAHLRTIKVKGYRQLIAAGGKMFEAVMQQFEHMRFFANTEGLTVMDAEDEFETHSYTFAGLDDVLTQMGDQVCGAVEIPRVRLFGESPGGLNADGESALRTYYDDTSKKQETVLRRPTQLLLDVLIRSVTGAAPPDGFSFIFNPLWQMSETDKSTIAKTTTEAVTTAYDAGLITAQAAAKELKASSRKTGIFGNISDDDIDKMEDVIPDPVEQAAAMAEATAPPGEDASQPGGGAAQPKKSKADAGAQK